MLDVSLNVAPCGRMETKPPLPSVSVIVTVSVTAVARRGTTSSVPSIELATDRTRSTPDGSLSLVWRLSYTRRGEIGWNAPDDVVPPISRHVPGVPAATHSHSVPVASSYSSPTWCVSARSIGWLPPGRRRTSARPPKNSPP